MLWEKFPPASSVPGPVGEVTDHFGCRYCNRNMYVKYRFRAKENGKEILIHDKHNMPGFKTSLTHLKVKLQNNYRKQKNKLKKIFINAKNVSEIK